MFFIGENDRRHADDYRPELHDSDGLQIAAGSGEWLWRPLDNPRDRRISSFVDRDPKGFGLMQRDRNFETYQDLEASYDRRPGYFVEPDGAWGEGAVMLMELPTDTETNDNIVACWRPASAYPAGTPVTLSYRVRAVGGAPLHPGGRVVNTFSVAPLASGTAKAEEEKGGLTRRFLVDFAGGELDYYRADPSRVEVVASTAPGPYHAQLGGAEPTYPGPARGLRRDPGGAGSGDRPAGVPARPGRALSETWVYPWTARERVLDQVEPAPRVGRSARRRRPISTHWWPSNTRPSPATVPSGGRSATPSARPACRSWRRSSATRRDRRPSSGRPRWSAGAAAAAPASPPSRSPRRASGLGLGSLVLDAAEADARAHGCTRLRLEVRADNGAGIRLYERRGYLRFAVIPDYYEDGMEAWRYEKSL